MLRAIMRNFKESSDYDKEVDTGKKTRLILAVEVKEVKPYMRGEGLFHFVESWNRCIYMGIISVTVLQINITVLQHVDDFEADMAEPNCAQILQVGPWDKGEAKYLLIIDQAIQREVVFTSLVDIMQRILALCYVTDREYPKYAKHTFQFLEKYIYEVSCNIFDNIWRTEQR